MSSSEFYQSHEGPIPESGKSIHEVLMVSSDRARDSVPKQYRAHFNELRNGILAFCKEFEIPSSALQDKKVFGEYLASRKPPVPLKRMEQAVYLFQGLEHLLTHHELWINPEALAEAEQFYRLKEQYTVQVDLLKRTGILHSKREQLPRQTKRLIDFFKSLSPFGKKKRPELKETKEILCITGIDGKEYPLPTLEQIAQRLFEQKELFEIKRDQGFTKLLLVPFGMSLEHLLSALKHFLLDYKKVHEDFRLHSADPLLIWDAFTYGDQEESPRLTYLDSTTTDISHPHTQSKAQILSRQTQHFSATPGWRIVFVQPSVPMDQTSKGIASIPPRDCGRIRGEHHFRHDVEASQSSTEEMNYFLEDQKDPSSPYFGESGMTPEDWAIAFMTHLQETGRPLDDWEEKRTENMAYLTGVYFPDAFALCYWNKLVGQVAFKRCVLEDLDSGVGARFAVVI